MLHGSDVSAKRPFSLYAPRLSVAQFFYIWMQFIPSLKNLKPMKRIFTRMLVVLLALATITTDAAAVSIVNPVAPVAPGTEPDPASVEAALKAFKALPAKEKKERLKEVKKAVKEFKAQKKAGKEPMVSTLALVIIAIFIPPLAVYLHQGEINSKFWISLLLTLLFYLPGLIYSLVVILGDA
jgi:uncharacterized membrane protein YqaE (UPF0057 family)